MEALFVFNRKIGSTDEAATVSERTEKLLFYSSTCGDALEEQLERLSMCEAFIDLCRSLDADDPCEAVFLDNHAYALYECEPDTWIVVCCRTRLGDMSEEDLVDLTSSSFATYLYRSPAMPKATSSSSSKRSPIGKLAFRRNASNASMRRRTSKSQAPVSSVGDNNVRIVESADPSAHVLRALLDRVYKQFLLYHGPIQDILWPGSEVDVPSRLKSLRKILRKTRQLQELVDEGDLNPDPEQAQLLREREANEDSLASMLAQSTADKARKLLASFLPALLAQIDFSRLHLLYEDCALPFATVDKDVMVSVQLFMGRLQNSFEPFVESCALIHAGEVVWSSLPMPTLRSMHTLLDIILCERTDAPNAGTSAPGNDAGRRRSRVQGSRLASANGDEGALAADLANRHTYPLAPCFLRTGSATDVLSHARAEDTADVYFPALYNAAEGKFQRVIVYGFERTLAVVFVPDTSSAGPDWDTRRLLDFAGTLEVFLHGELSALVGTMSRDADGDLIAAISWNSAESVLSSSRGDVGDAVSALGMASPSPVPGAPLSPWSGAGAGNLYADVPGVNFDAGPPAMSGDAGSGARPGWNFRINAFGGRAAQPPFSPQQQDTHQSPQLLAQQSPQPAPHPPRGLAQGRGSILGSNSSTATASSGGAAEPEEQYLYINESSSVVSIADAWLSKLGRPPAESFPSNHDLGLLFTSNLMTAVNDARHEFAADPTERMLIIQFVRPNAYQHQASCWLAAIKSGARQVYLLVDPKHSFEYVNQRARGIRENALSSILV